MSEHDWLAERFEENRPHLRAVAYRMLGSSAEADDAVQETWLRLSRAGTGEVENLGGWLTTIVARVSLNMLRSRTLRREEPMDPPATGQPVAPPNGTDPEHEAVLADSVGLALLVVLDTLTPAERLAFVLHDMFAVPFEEIAPIVERSPVATRQLASRARRRVEARAGGRRPGDPPGEISRRREVVAAFLAASREGDFDALLTMLDPDIVLRADNAAAQMGADSRAMGGGDRPARGGGHLLRAGQGSAARAHRRRSGRGVDVSRRDAGRVRLRDHRRHDHRDRADRRPGAHCPVRGDPPQSRAEGAQRGQLAGSSGIALARTTLA